MKPVFMLAIVGMLLAEPQIDPASTENVVRYVLAQGGLTSLLVFMGWSYRRDFMRLTDQRAERIGLLTDMVVKSTEAQTKTADALVQSATALASQAESIRSMASALNELKGTIIGRRDGHD